MDTRYDRTVAIKMLREELAGAITNSRFLKEIRIAARLNHPHIVPLFDSGEHRGRPFYVMPFVEGESLRQRIDQHGALTLAEARQIVREVGSAIAYAHANGIVHRDIKPENILLTDGHAAVADFGIARALAQAGGETLTVQGTALGTPLYMSPEQGSGDRVDERTDIYSLGCVLHEILTGEPPFTGPTAQAIVASHIVDAPPKAR
ncbi:MAG: serine/threonine-protein kinase, partial [Acidimicrobiia bacterium]